MVRFVESKIRHTIEALVSAFLLGFQYIPVYGPWYGFMIFPFAFYITSLLWLNPEFFRLQLNLLLLSERLMFGRMVAVVGLIIFLVACFQFLRRRDKIITSGLYSVVRHPQYFGIMVMTLGISIMSIQYAGRHPEVLWNGWLIQALGYVLLAGYEERHLVREYEKEYQQYRQRVPFVFPVPAATEQGSSIVLALIIAFLFTFL